MPRFIYHEWPRPVDGLCAVVGMRMPQRNRRVYDVTVGACIERMRVWKAAQNGQHVCIKSKLIAIVRKEAK